MPTRPTQDEPVSERRADASARYQGFDGQYVNGSWRPGRHGGVRIAQDEIFGPIAPIIKVKDEEEALRVANQTQYGLSSAVFTRDRERGVTFALRVEAGMTHVNDHTVDDTPAGPFGGEKNSGLGRFGGEWILREFARDHWVTVRHPAGRYPF